MNFRVYSYRSIFLDLWVTVTYNVNHRETNKEELEMNSTKLPALNTMFYNPDEDWDDSDLTPEEIATRNAIAAKVEEVLQDGYSWYFAVGYGLPTIRKESLADFASVHFKTKYGECYAILEDDGNREIYISSPEDIDNLMDKQTIDKGDFLSNKEDVMKKIDEYANEQRQELVDNLESCDGN